MKKKAKGGARKAKKRLRDLDSLSRSSQRVKGGARLGRAGRPKRV